MSRPSWPVLTHGGNRRRSTPRLSYRPEVEELEGRTSPAVLTPLQVRQAYGFDQIYFSVAGQRIVGDGSGQTIAIVNAFRNPNILNDVDTFSRAFSLNGTQTLYEQYGPATQFLKRVSPQGAPVKDRTGGLWHLETALDVQWVHAMAPGAQILLVEAKSDSYAHLLAAVNYARRQPGVVAISMSWGSPEFVGQTAYDSFFTTPQGHRGGSNGLGGPRLPGGITFVAASGDTGAPGGWPALSPNVVAVGGTTLLVDSWGRYQGEVGWSGSGGGISSQQPQPFYQSTVTFTTQRTNPDVAYNGDPATGVYVYSSMPLHGQPGGWWQVGGTSAGAPQWAALIAIANQGRALQGLGSLDGPTQTLPALYQMPASAWNDVTQGYNGFAAGPGYDLVTGLGSPRAAQVVHYLLQAQSQGTATPSAKMTRPKGSALPVPTPLMYVTPLTTNISVTVAMSLRGIAPAGRLGWNANALLGLLLQRRTEQAPQSGLVERIALAAPRSVAVPTAARAETSHARSSVLPPVAVAEDLAAFFHQENIAEMLPPDSVGWPLDAASDTLEPYPHPLWDGADDPTSDESMLALFLVAGSALSLHGIAHPDFVRERPSGEPMHVG